MPTLPPSLSTPITPLLSPSLSFLPLFSPIFARFGTSPNLLLHDHCVSIKSQAPGTFLSNLWLTNRQHQPSFITVAFITFWTLFNLSLIVGIRWNWREYLDCTFFTWFLCCILFRISLTQLMSLNQQASQSNHFLPTFANHTSLWHTAFIGLGKGAKQTLFQEIKARMVHLGSTHSLFSHAVLQGHF